MESPPVGRRIVGRLQLHGSHEVAFGQLQVSPVELQDREPVVRRCVPGILGDGPLQHFAGALGPVERSRQQFPVAIVDLTRRLPVLHGPAQVSGGLPHLGGEVLDEQHPEPLIELRVIRLQVRQVFPILAGPPVAARGQVQFTGQKAGLRVVRLPLQ